MNKSKPIVNVPPSNSPYWIAHRAEEDATATWAPLAEQLHKAQRDLTDVRRELRTSRMRVSKPVMMAESDRLKTLIESLSIETERAMDTLRKARARVVLEVARLGFDPALQRQEREASGKRQIRLIRDRSAWHMHVHRARVWELRRWSAEYLEMSHRSSTVKARGPAYLRPIVMRALSSALMAASDMLATLVWEDPTKAKDPDT